MKRWVSMYFSIPEIYSTVRFFWMLRFAWKLLRQALLLFRFRRTFIPSMSVLIFSFFQDRNLQPLVLSFQFLDCSLVRLLASRSLSISLCFYLLGGTFRSLFFIVDIFSIKLISSVISSFVELIFLIWLIWSECVVQKKSRCLLILIRWFPAKTR